MIRIAPFTTLLKLQRADAQQFPGGSDHGRAAPVGVSRRSKDRLVQHIFPIAGELLLGDDARRNRALTSSGAGHDNAFADLGLAGMPDRQRRQVEPRKSLHQTESGFLIIGKSMARHRWADTGSEPD